MHGLLYRDSFSKLSSINLVMDDTGFAPYRGKQKVAVIC